MATTKIHLLLKIGRISEMLKLTVLLKAHHHTLKRRTDVTITAVASCKSEKIGRKETEFPAETLFHKLVT